MLKVAIRQRIHTRRRRIEILKLEAQTILLEESRSEAGSNSNGCAGARRTLSGPQVVASSAPLFEPFQSRNRYRIRPLFERIDDPFKAPL